MPTSINSCGVLIVIQMLSFLHKMRTSRVTTIPAECKRYTPARLVKCCPLTPMFNEDSLKACGISPDKRPSPLDKNCRPTVCLFKNLGVLGRNNSIVYPKLIAALDYYAERNRHVRNGAKLAKLYCVGKRRGPPQPRPPFGPRSDPDTCELHKTFICFTTLILWNCQFRRSARCKAISDDMDKCREFVFRERDLKSW